MLNQLKKTSVKLSLVAALAITPSAVLGANGSAVVEGSSESTSAMIESPNVEQQVVRINVGINLVRLNTDIMERMPVSEDSEWVDTLTTPMTSEMYNKVMALNSVKNDAYYSTVMISNAFLGRVALPMTMLNARLYHQMSAIYKNETNGHEGFKLPNVQKLPDITSVKSYVTFYDEPKVQIIDVQAVGGNLYKNVEEATLSLLPEDLQEEVSNAKDEYKAAKDAVGDAESKVGTLEGWLDDDANANHPERGEKESALATANAEVKEAETVFDAKEEIYFKLLENGAAAIENNFDESKVKLAKKLEKLLDAVDNNAIGAGSMFAAATAHIVKNGMGTLDDELKAITLAQAASNLVGNQKQYLVERAARLGKGILLALPNIGIGSFYAIKQTSLAGEYQQIVNKVLEGAKAAEEAAKAEAEAQKVEEASK